MQLFTSQGKRFIYPLVTCRPYKKPVSLANSILAEIGTVVEEGESSRQQDPQNYMTFEGGFSRHMHYFCHNEIGEEMMVLKKQTKITKKSSLLSQDCWKEDQIDELRLQRNQDFWTDRRYTGTVANRLSATGTIRVWLVYEGVEQSQTYLNHLAEQRHHFDTKMQEDYEDVQQAYQTFSRRLDDEVERLHKEECHLLWD